jgi:hypothetical protein
MATTAQPTHSGLLDRSVSKHPDLSTQWSAKTGSGNGHAGKTIARVYAVAIPMPDTLDHDIFNNNSWHNLPHEELTHSSHEAKWSI